MIDDRAVEAAFANAIRAVTDLQLFDVTTNVPIGQPPPYLYMQHVPVSQTDAAVSGGAIVALGFVTVTVLAEPNAVAIDAARTALRTVAVAFPYGRRLTLSGTPKRATVTQTPVQTESRRDGPFWRVTNRIDYVVM